MLVPTLTLVVVPGGRGRHRGRAVHRLLGLLRKAGADVPAVLGEQAGAVFYVPDDCIH